MLSICYGTILLWYVLFLTIYCVPSLSVPNSCFLLYSICFLVALVLSWSVSLSLVLWFSMSVSVVVCFLYVLVISSVSSVCFPLVKLFSVYLCFCHYLSSSNVISSCCLLSLVVWLFHLFKSSSV